MAQEETLRGKWPNTNNNIITKHLRVGLGAVIRINLTTDHMMHTRPITLSSEVGFSGRLFHVRTTLCRPSILNRAHQPPQRRPMDTLLQNNHKGDQPCGGETEWTEGTWSGRGHCKTAKLGGDLLRPMMMTQMVVVVCLHQPR